MSAAPGAANGHGLDQPTLTDLRDAVHRAARGDALAWMSMCAEARVSPHATSADLATLDRLVAAGEARSGLVQLAAISFSIRLTAFRSIYAAHTARTAS